MEKNETPGNAGGVSDEVFCLVKKLETVIRHTMYTVDGEVYVCEGNNKELFPLPLEIEDFTPTSAKMKEVHWHAMKVVYELVKEIHELKRAVPPTREELKNRGIGKKVLNQLCGLGLLKRQLVPLVSEEDKKMKGARDCVYFTAQGRGYVRKFFDRDYATGGKDLWDGVKDAAISRRRQREGNLSAEKHGGPLQ